jgi:hypothetical protein
VLTKKAGPGDQNSEFQDFQGPEDQNSRTFQDLEHFPGLSRALNFSTQNSRVFQDQWLPCNQGKCQLHFVFPAKFEKYMDYTYNDHVGTDMPKNEFRSLCKRA